MELLGMLAMLLAAMAMEMLKMAAVGFGLVAGGALALKVARHNKIV